MEQPREYCAIICGVVFPWVGYASSDDEMLERLNATFGSEGTDIQVCALT